MSDGEENDGEGEVGRGGEEEGGGGLAGLSGRRVTFISQHSGLRCCWRDTPVTRMGLLLGFAVACVAGLVAVCKCFQLVRGSPAESPRSASSPGQREVSGIFKQECVVSPVEACSLAAMPRDVSTMVYPGGQTRCMFSAKPDYAFQVIPGDRDKLLIFFQGGGGCWDLTSMTSNVVRPRHCATSVTPQPLVGVFDRVREENPYRSFTVIHIQYCSGDLHGGNNRTRLYRGSSGARVDQMGFFNAKAALDWGKANLDGQLSSLVLSGCSAGAVGAQLWAQTALQMFSYNTAAVIMDSHAGVFPDGSEGTLLRQYGTCDTGLLTGELRVACATGKLTLGTVFETAMRAFPNVAFASINSKSDWRQIQFFREMASEHGGSVRMKKSDFYAKMNMVLERQSMNENYVSYLVNADQHCYTTNPLLYTADVTGLETRRALQDTAAPAGESDKEPLQGHLPLMQWLAQLPRHGEHTIASQCAGRPLPRADWQGHDYCDEALIGKALRVALGSGATRALTVALAAVFACMILGFSVLAFRARRRNRDLPGDAAGKAVLRDRVGELQAKTRRVRESLADLRMQLQFPGLGRLPEPPGANAGLGVHGHGQVQLASQDSDQSAIPLIWTASSDGSFQSGALPPARGRF